MYQIDTRTIGVVLLGRGAALMRERERGMCAYGEDEVEEVHPLR